MGHVLGTLAAAGAAHLHFVLLTEYVYLLILFGGEKDFGLVAQPEGSAGELRRDTFARRDRYLRSQR